MGFYKNLAIENANRNEALEAHKLISEVRRQILTEHANADSDENAEVLKDWEQQLENALRLIKRFSDKHQPSPERYK